LFWIVCCWWGWNGNLFDRNSGRQVYHTGPLPIAQIIKTHIFQQSTSQFSRSSTGRLDIPNLTLVLVHPSKSSLVLLVPKIQYLQGQVENVAVTVPGILRQFDRNQLVEMIKTFRRQKVKLVTVQVSAI
jgi:hypothetical protein